MSAEISLPTLPEVGRTEPSRRNNIICFAALTAIAIVSFVIRVYVGSQSFLDYDEWQHVFIAAVPRATDFRFEMRAEAHPPLSYWMLRGLLHIGHGPLWYRIIFILSGTGTVFFVGLICRKACRSLPIALLSAAAIAFATSAITVSTEVRSYPLSSFFMLAAFFWYMDIVPKPGGAPKWPPYVGFAAATSLALASHYYAAFFLGACFAVPVLLVVFSREYRADLIFSRDRRPALLFLGALLVPLGVLLGMYVAHVRKQPIQGYLYDFYWRFRPHETALGFLWRNLQNLWNLFAPIEIQNRWTFLAVLVAFVVCAVYCLYKTVKADRANPIRALTILFAFVLVAELIVLSLADQYPMGGLLRHQYVVAPFLLIAVFIMADAILQGFGPKVRAGMALGIGGWILLHFTLAPSLVVLPGYLISKKDYDDYRSVFPNAKGIFLDHWSVIGYFMNTDSEPRRFVRRIAAPGLVDQYEVGESPADKKQIFYNKLDFLLDLRNEDTYRSFAACLHETGLRELTLFFFAPGANQLPEPPDEMRRTMEQLAARQGLRITKAAITPKTVFAGFVLQ